VVGREKRSSPLTPAARKRALGQLGERLAAQHIEARGYRLIERNYRCPYGELDILAWDGDTLVAVEVRTRLGGTEAAPEESIGRRKRERLCGLAEHYRAERFPDVQRLRIDVVAVHFTAGGVLRRVELWQDAVGEG
jgi:putative endonuclease